jgi:hypothetical protein
MPQGLRRALRWAPLVVVCVELVLVISGWPSPAQGAVALVALEALLAAVVGASALTLRKSFRRLRGDGVARWSAFQQSLHNVLPDRVASLIAHELGMLRAFWLGLRRTADIPEAGVAVRYARELRPLLAAVSVACLVEIIAVGTLVGLVVSWPGVRWALLGLSVYGWLWLLGFRAALAALPHVVGPTTLRLRFALFVDTELPLELVASARPDRKGGYRRTSTVHDGVLAVSVMGRTNVHVALNVPHQVELPGGASEVTGVRFYADRPADAAAAVLAGRTAAVADETPDDRRAAKPGVERRPSRPRPGSADRSFRPRSEPH